MILKTGVFFYPSHNRNFRIFISNLRINLFNSFTILKQLRFYKLLPKLIKLILSRVWNFLMLLIPKRLIISCQICLFICNNLHFIQLFSDINLIILNFNFLKIMKFLVLRCVWLVFDSMNDVSRDLLCQFFKS